MYSSIFFFLTFLNKAPFVKTLRSFFVYFLQLLHHIFHEVKEGLQRLLRIGSAHNIGGLHDLEIAQISHVLNFFEHKLYLLFI